MIRPSGQSLSTRGGLTSALGLSTAGMLTLDREVTSGCTVVPRTLMTKGVVPCPSADGGLALVTRGVMCCPVVIVEIPDEPQIPVRPSVGGGGVSQPQRDKRKRVKVTVLMSGNTFTEEVIVDPSVSIKAQVLGVVDGIQEALFITVRRRDG